VLPIMTSFCSGLLLSLMGLMSYVYVCARTRGGEVRVCRKYLTLCVLFEGGGGHNTHTQSWDAGECMSSRGGGTQS
jgi:hypothetical protein